jgi:asparagine synthase (glutamine-hydrolysing)
MCGIAGILDPRHTLSDAATRLDALQRALQHRGPDDHGVWSSPSGIAHLAHTRLSILDLSAAGHQPMQLPGGRFTITFNGEIYNFRELRTELEREGTSFHTGTDTEVLLRLYERHGTDMLGRLRGMFAFAIWDEQERTCFLARDALGIKPLYHATRNDVFAFASELRSLQTAGLAGEAIDAHAIASYFETGSVPEPLTLLRDARMLEAGHFILWKAGRMEKRAWWSLSFSSAGADIAQPAQTLRAALLDSTRHHFVSDVPVGIFLSGGIDSTALVALARETGVRDIDTFSIGVDDTALDESGVARRTAAHFGTRHHELRLTETEGMRQFHEFIQHIDQPSIDGFNTFTVSRFAREQGLKVVLSGLGGDELFAGYPSFTQVPRLVLASRALDLVPGLRQYTGMRLEQHGASHRLRRLGAYLQSPATVRNAYRAFRGIFSPRAARILAARYAGVTLAELLDFTPPGPDLPPMPAPRDEVSLCELSLYMRNQLLKDSDVMSMASSLELRVPFVDRMLVETVARIPASRRLRQGKKLLVEALPELPGWVVNQPKRGFLFPYQKWAASSWEGLFEQAASRLPVQNPTWYQLWAVFMLDRWLEQRGITRAS